MDMRLRLELAYLPVLVETTTAFFRQMLSPDVAQGTRSEWGLDVADSSNDHNWRRFQDGNGFHDFLLVDLCGMDRNNRLGREI